jgi:hypothetical protein
MSDLEALMLALHADPYFVFNPMNDYFCCLTAVVWGERGAADPISVAEWAMRYDTENNQ